MFDFIDSLAISVEHFPVIYQLLSLDHITFVKVMDDLKSKKADIDSFISSNLYDRAENRKNNSDAYNLEVNQFINQFFTDILMRSIVNKYFEQQSQGVLYFMDWSESNMREAMFDRLKFNGNIDDYIIDKIGLRSAILEHNTIDDDDLFSNKSIMEIRKDKQIGEI